MKPQSYVWAQFYIALGCGPWKYLTLTYTNLTHAPKSYNTYRINTILV